MFKTNRKKEKNKWQPQVNPGPCCLIPPDQLNFLRHLGDGQYGSVQMAEWKPEAGSHKYVAVKSLKNAGVDGVITSMLKEVATLQTLQHAHIVQLYGISLPAGDEPLKLVTEYASLGSLHEYLIRKNDALCQVSQLSTFAVQVADGMRYLASRQLVHRDLSTRNILVFEPYLVKISDFGLARVLEEDGAREITLRQKLAVAWLPPESITQNIFTPASDVWSYGITLWEMFTFGEKPFREASTFQMVKDIVKTDPIKHLPKPLASSSDFYDVMLSCWKRVPDERPSFEDIYKRTHSAQFKFQEGLTTVTHRTAEEGHLSYGCKQKVTIISSCAHKMLIVQLDNGAIGKVAAANVDLKSKAPQKDRGGCQISRPYNIQKLDSKEIIPEVKETPSKPFSRRTGFVHPGAKSKQNGSKLIKEASPAHQAAVAPLLSEEDEEDTASLGQTYPDPYPNINKRYDLLEERESSSRPVEPTAGLSASNTVEGGTEWVGASDDFGYAHFSVTGIGHPPSVRSNEYTSMEPGVGPMDDVLGQCTFMENNDYVSMGNESSSSLRDRIKSESDVGRENVVENDYDVLIWGRSSPRDDSLVYPSRNLQNPGPKRNPPAIPDRSDLIRKNNCRADRASTISLGECRKKPVPLPRKKKRESPRPTSHGQLITIDPHLEYDSTKGSVSEGVSAQALKLPVVSLATEERSNGGHAGMTAAEVTSRSAPEGQAENPQFGNFLELSSSGWGEEEKESASPPELPPKVRNRLFSESNYERLLILPPPPEINPAILNQPPPPSQETSRDPGTNPNVSNGRQLAGSTQDIYGDEINRKIREIQVVCPDASKDDCYAALLQYQGDVEESLTALKPIQLAVVTEKDVELCRRSLKHCGGSMERAANYIIDLE